MRNEKVKNLVLSAMFFAIGLVLPLVTGQVPQIGQMLLPMHLPVFLCSLICGWQYGLPVGFLLPLVRSLIFQMPPLFPTAVAMSFELAAYGFFAGFLYRILLNKGWKQLFALFTAMIAAMVIGRLVWGAAMWVLMSIGGKGFTFEAFLAGAVINAIPGIVMQIVLIPTVMLSLERSRSIGQPQNRNY